MRFSALRWQRDYLMSGCGYWRRRPNVTILASGSYRWAISTSSTAGRHNWCAGWKQPDVQ